MDISNKQPREQLFGFLALSMVRARNIFNRVNGRAQSTHLKKIGLAKTFSDPAWYEQLDTDLRQEFKNISIYLSQLLTITPEETVYKYLDKLLASEWQVSETLREKMIEGIKRAFSEVKK